ncbi:hypothetical protein ACQUW5_01370 [Legionella sp. CNM-1927-20]|uniref:hypothetical protein n=1 Tax=Legionella sp. CNM-1927-20 TaxID=3422221 RepID=UPI00403B20BB
MKQHSELFNELTKEEKTITIPNKEIQLDPKKVQEKLRNSQSDHQAIYRDMSDLLRETNDAQYGIVSTYDQDKNEWIRDATKAIPLDKRMSPDAPVITANNMLLRCLSRLRPIDYAIGKKYKDNHEVAQPLREEIRENFSKLAFEVLQIAQSKDNDQVKQKKIARKEEEFNTFLVQQLHNANLTAGCESRKDAEKLLFHYRNLSSVLYPARTMVTLTYDDEARILQRETQYPVTKKTDQQKEELEKLESIIPYPDKEQKNSHTHHNLAIQEADKLFKDLIASDETALPAQARKTHLVGVKNGFIVKVELTEMERSQLDNPEPLSQLQTEEKKEHVLWLARMGSPVFVGLGENDDNLQTHTRENLEQIRTAAAEKMGKDVSSLNIHVTTLNTYTFSEDQHIIINHVYKATRERADEDKHDNVSYVPTNFDGTNRALDIAPGLNFDKEEPQPKGTSPTQKATRVESAATIILAASNTPNTISLVHCASGQDRTGTAIERAIQKWMHKVYRGMGLKTDNIELTRAVGGNAAEITSHLVHGSPGMKSDSIANNFLGRTIFSPKVQARFYLKSAETNKRNKVGNVDFLKKPSDLALVEYNKWLREFSDKLQEVARLEDWQKEKNKKNLVVQGDNIIKQVKALAKNNPEKLDSRNLHDLTLVLSTAHAALTDLKDKNKTQSHARELANLAQHVSGKKSSGWRTLGIVLLAFSCLTLAVIGIAAIGFFTGGIGFLPAALAVAGLAGTIGAGVGATVGAGVIGAVGATLIYKNREKGVAKSVSQFKEALSEIKDELPEEQGAQNSHLNPVI